ncbi:MAG: hypothetical protein KAJ98_09270, partial [Spirochaetaceae bacterium]|nr:hypothetical protein [Spirochaetaceae bacterium]
SAASAGNNRIPVFGKQSCKVFALFIIRMFTIGSCRSENGYRRALTLDPRYTPAMYALAALLVFELDRSPEAGPLLEDFLKIERSDVNARFLLARVYLEAGMTGDALDLYDEIIRLAKDQTDVIKAEDLYNRVSGGDYGS